MWCGLNILFLAAKSRLFEANTALAVPLRGPGCTPLQNAEAGSWDTPTACESAPCASRTSASGHALSGRARPGRWAPERGRYVSWDSFGWVGQGGAGEPEVEPPICVRDTVPSRPAAVVPVAAHAAVHTLDASGHVCGTGRGAESVAHMAVALRSSARAFRALSDDASGVWHPDFACCGAENLADNIDVHVCAFAHRCGHTGHS